MAEPARLMVDVLDGGLQGHHTRYENRLRDLDGLYQDPAAFAAAVQAAPDRLAYWVESSVVEKDTGALTIGVSTLAPGTVGDEYMMTRGHLHTHPEQAELYYGIRGTGVMLLDTADGKSRAVEISPGIAVHVPGHWVHRSVNVGDEALVTLFCYATQAGQDYAIIERAGGMRDLVVTSPDGWRLRPNPSHRGYRD